MDGFEIHGDENLHKFFTMSPHLLHDLGLTPIAIVTYEFLLRYQNTKRVPKQSDIAKKYGVSPNTVTDAVKDLEQAGLIRVTRIPGKPSVIELLPIWAINVCVYEDKGEGVVQRIARAKQRLRERAGIEPPEPPPAKQTETAKEEPHGSPDQALAEVFPGLSLMGKPMWELQQFVYRVKGTANQVRRWKTWARNRYPSVQILDHFKFQATFAEMVEEERGKQSSAASPTPSPPRADCPKCKGDGYYTDFSHKPPRTVPVCECRRGTSGRMAA